MNRRNEIILFFTNHWALTVFRFVFSLHCTAKRLTFSHEMSIILQCRITSNDIFIRFESIHHLTSPPGKQKAKKESRTTHTHSSVRYHRELTRKHWNTSCIFLNWNQIVPSGFSTRPDLSLKCIPSAKRQCCCNCHFLRVTWAVFSLLLSLLHC